MARGEHWVHWRHTPHLLFVKVGLSGADMGACGLLPRVIGVTLCWDKWP